MGPISRAAVRRPGRALIIWLIVVALIGAAAGAFRGTLEDSFTLPDTPSTQAQEILEAEFPGASAPSQVRLVFTGGGSIADPATVAAMEELAGQVREIPEVESVTLPYFPEAGQAGLISPDGTIGIGLVNFAGQPGDISPESIRSFVSDVSAANTPTLTVGASGDVLDFAQEVPSSELFGVVVALVILLIMFGAIVAAGMPIVTALLSVGVGSMLVLLVANVISVATFAPTLSAMIGLGVGIDYALFIINRHRQAVRDGHDFREAAMIATSTAGRAVVFAGTAVIIALLGLFVLRIDFMNGIAIAAAVTVLTVMVSAVTLLPALLSLLGKRLFALKMPWAKSMHEPRSDGRMGRHAVRIQQRPVLAIISGLIIMVIFAIPAVSMQQGFPDNSTRPDGSPQRIAYDLTATAFGPGAAGPLLIVGSLSDPSDPAQQAVVAELSAAAGTTAGVQFASPPIPSESGAAYLITVQPQTGPQSSETRDLAERIGDEVIPPIVEGTGVSAYVGGSTAILIDFGTVLADALPLFLAVVIGLGCIALIILFRSILIPITAAVTSLLSFFAALGVTVAVFQWGWGASLIGVETTGPILPFLPVMLFAILFGLSMDYQVFLVSRMQEEWGLRRDNRQSVFRGVVGSGLVVAVAALIMFSVFASFIFGADATIKMFGLALATAILLDAFVVRLLLVPAIMTILGRSNWWMPQWAQRVLPTIDLEKSSVEPEPRAAQSS